MATADNDRFELGDLVVGWHPPTSKPIGGQSPVGPETPGIVVRVHQIKLMDDTETQEVWVLREGREERGFGSELMRLESD